MLFVLAQVWGGLSKIGESTLQDIDIKDVTMDLLIEKLRDCHSDLWEDAKMPEVVAYLRGNRHLKVPPEYKSRLPTSL